MHELCIDYGIGWSIGLVLLVLWSIFWKGLALWRSANRGEKVWFIILLVVNTAGILEIIYLFMVTGAKLSDFSISGHSHSDPTPS
jgi:hypothetical protein